MASASTAIENETNKAKEELRQQMSDIIIDTTQKFLAMKFLKKTTKKFSKKQPRNYRK
jgi:F0F1-type ATP synthase membrane subunit b/b'